MRRQHCVWLLVHSARVPSERKSARSRSSARSRIQLRTSHDFQLQIGLPRCPSAQTFNRPDLLSARCWILSGYRLSSVWHSTFRGWAGQTDDCQTARARRLDFQVFQKKAKIKNQKGKRRVKLLSCDSDKSRSGEDERRAAGRAVCARWRERAYMWGTSILL